MYSSNIIFGDPFQKSIVSGFLKRTAHSCAWYIAHIVSIVDHGAGRSPMLTRYILYINLCNVGLNFVYMISVFDSIMTFVWLIRT